MIIGTGKVVVACWTSLLRERRSLLGRWVGWESICGSRRRKRRGGEGKKEIKSENRIVWKRGAMELKMPGQRDDFHLLPGAGRCLYHFLPSQSDLPVYPLFFCIRVTSFPDHWRDEGWFGGWVGRWCTHVPPSITRARTHWSRDLSPTSPSPSPPPPSAAPPPSGLRRDITTGEKKKKARKYGELFERKIVSNWDFWNKMSKCTVTLTPH